MHKLGGVEGYTMYETIEFYDDKGFDLTNIRYFVRGICINSMDNIDSLFETKHISRNLIYIFMFCPKLYINTIMVFLLCLYKFIQVFLLV